MTIRTKLLINVLSLVCSFLIIAVVLNIVRNEIFDSVDKGFYADRIVVGVSDMNTITYGYLMNPSERARQQWELKHASLDTIIKGGKFDAEEERVIVSRIMANHADAEQFFKRIIQNAEKKKNAPVSERAILDEINARFVTQLLARSQNMISDAYSLSSASYEVIRKVQTWSLWFIVISILIVTMSASATSFFLSRAIHASIQTLKRGTEAVAEGDLDQRVPVMGGDEIAILSKAFNEMTDRLKISYSSLAKEIEEKGKAQQALQEAHDELEHRVEERTKELSISEHKISSILSSITDCYLFLDREWRVKQINDQALRYLQTKREDLNDKIWWEVFPSGLSSFFGEQYKRAIMEDIPVHFDTQSIIVDRWAEVHAYPSEEGLSIYFRDITDRKQAEAETARLASFPRLNPSPIVEIDPSGKVSFCNPAAEELFPDIRQRGNEHPWLSDWESLSRTASESRAGVTTREVDCSGRWYQQTIYHVQKTRHLRIYGMDITERKNAEEGLKQHAAKLESANKELESFSYSVSHDLRAPLRAIDGFARMLLRDSEKQIDKEGKRKLNVIRDNALKMGQLIDDLLNFSRLGSTAMSHSEFDMNDIANELWKELRETNPSRVIEMRIGALPAGSGDLNLIRYAISNLLSNAIKFTRPRETAIIEFEGESNGNENIYSIKDNGIGFNMKYYDKLFGVFQRLHSDEGFEGTGVGLAIVKRVIDRHGGRIWAEGKANEGAKFYFTLPIG